MTVLGIHLLGSPVLREAGRPVAVVDDEVRRLVADLFETMEGPRAEWGLAANQVGVARRIAVVDAEGERFAMINPRIVEASGKDTAEEGVCRFPSTSRR